MKNIYVKRVTINGMMTKRMALFERQAVQRPSGAPFVKFVTNGIKGHNHVFVTCFVADIAQVDTEALYALKRLKRRDMPRNVPTVILSRMQIPRYIHTSQKIEKKCRKKLALPPVNDDVPQIWPWHHLQCKRVQEQHQLQSQSLKQHHLK